MPAQPNFPAALEALERAFAALSSTTAADQPHGYRLKYLRTLEQILELQRRIEGLQAKYTPPA
ncbi:hypothetical protein D3C84_1139180 [compost metagenome]